MKLYVLEDQFEHQNRMERILRNLGCHQDSMFITKDKQKILDDLFVNGNQNVYLLDLEIDGEQQEGIAFSKQIRSMDLDGPIVFITSHEELALVTYQALIGALDFIPKNVTDEEMQERLSRILVKAKERWDYTQGEWFEWKTTSHAVKIPMEDIYYLESAGFHLIHLVTSIKTLEFYGALTEIQEKFPSLFRCGRSLLLNPSVIKTVDYADKMITFDEKTELKMRKSEIARLRKYLSQKGDEG